MISSFNFMSCGTSEVSASPIVCIVVCNNGRMVNNVDHMRPWHTMRIDMTVCYIPVRNKIPVIMRDAVVMMK